MLSSFVEFLCSGPVARVLRSDRIKFCCAIFHYNTVPNAANLLPFLFHDMQFNFQKETGQSIEIEWLGKDSKVLQRVLTFIPVNTK